MKILIFYYISGSCVKIKWTGQARRLRRKGTELTVKPESHMTHPWDSHGGKKDPTPLNCPLTIRIWEFCVFPNTHKQTQLREQSNLELVYGTWRSRVYWAVQSIIYFYHLLHFLFFIINIVVIDCYVLAVCHQWLHRFLRRLFSGKEKIYFNVLSLKIEKEILTWI